MRFGLAIGCLICVLLNARMVGAQVPSASPAFEVAAIRAASLPTPETVRSGQFRAGTKIDGDNVDFEFVTLADLIPYAFQVKSFQVVGPAWSRESRWNIKAKLPEGASHDQVPEMVQGMLADRFRLVIHHEKREQPVYELVVAKGGPKLQPSTAGEDAGAADAASGLPGAFPGAPFGRPPGDGPGNGPPNGNGGGGRGMMVIGGPAGTARIAPDGNCGLRMEFRNVTLPNFADTLTPFLDRPVVDGIALKGTYQAVLKLPMEVMFTTIQNMARNSGMPAPGQGRGPGGPEGRGRGGPGGEPAGAGRGPAGCADPAALAACGSDNSNAAIFQAVQQLGLKLQARKAPFDTIVIDQLEKTPTDN